MDGATRPQIHHQRHHHALPEPAPNHNGSELAEVLSALRLEQAQERRSLLLALRKREQYHSERLSRIEKHQETQLGTMSSQLTSLSRQLQRTSSEQRQPPLTHPQPWRGRSGRPPPQETDSSSSGARGPQQTTREVKAQFHPGEDRIRILDSPEERRTARRLRIARRLEEIPVQELGLGDILRLRRTSSPDPGGLPDCGKEGSNAALESQNGVTGPLLPGSRIP